MLITTPQQLKEEFARVIGEEAMNNFVRNYESADNLKDPDTETLDQYFEYMFESGLLSSIVASAFNWYNSPQGHEYWKKVDVTWFNRLYVYSIVSDKQKESEERHECKPEQTPIIPQNAIVINGVVYEYVDKNEPDECDECALREQCDALEGDDSPVLCQALFGVLTDGVFVRRD